MKFFFLLFMLSHIALADEVKTELEFSFSPESKANFISKKLIPAERFSDLKVIANDKAADPDIVMIDSQDTYSAGICYRGDHTKAQALVRKLITISGREFSLVNVQSQKNEGIFYQHRQSDAVGGIAVSGTIKRCDEKVRGSSK